MYVCQRSHWNFESRGLTVIDKGQLILKGLFGFFNSLKKWTKNFCLSRLGQKLTFSSSFFGRIEGIKISFRDIIFSEPSKILKPLDSSCWHRHSWLIIDDYWLNNPSVTQKELLLMNKKSKHFHAAFIGRNINWLI